MLSFPLGKEATRQAVRQVPPRQLLTFPQVKEAVLPQQAARQALSFLLGKEALPQAIDHPPPREVSNSSPVGSQAGALLPSREGSSSQAIAHLPPREVSNSSPAHSQAGALLPSREGSSSSPASSQAGTLLPSREGSSSLPAIAHLPPGEGSNSSPAGSQSGTLLPTREGSNSLLVTAHLPSGEGAGPPQQVNQAIKLGQSGKALGSLTGIGHPRLPRRTALSPRKTTSPLPPVCSPKGLLMKILTLSGSLTFPTNL